MKFTQPNQERNNSQGNCVIKRKMRLKKKLKSKENEAIKIGFLFLLFMKSSLPTVNHVLLLCFLHTTLTATHNPEAKTDWASKIVRFGESRFEEASLGATNTYLDNKFQIKQIICRE